MRQQNEPDDMSVFDHTPGSPYYEDEPEELSFDDEDAAFEEYAAYQESLLEEEQYQYKQDILYDRH